MARAHFVKSARKDNPVAKKGESYYWWQFAFCGKSYSKTAPKRSQLTQSEFLSQIYDIEDRLSDIGTDDIENAKSERDSLVDEIRELGEEQEERRNNMPEQLQDSNSGSILESRIESCEEFASELEAVDLDIEEDESIEDDEEREEDFNSRVEDAIEELTSISYNGE